MRSAALDAGGSKGVAGTPRTAGELAWDMVHKVGAILILVGAIYLIISGYARTQSREFYTLGDLSNERPPATEAAIILFFVFLFLVFILLAVGLKRSRGLARQPSARLSVTPRRSSAIGADRGAEHV